MRADFFTLHCKNCRFLVKTRIGVSLLPDEIIKDKTKKKKLAFTGVLLEKMQYLPKKRKREYQLARYYARVGLLCFVQNRQKKREKVSSFPQIHKKAPNISKLVDNC